MIEIRLIDTKHCPVILCDYCGDEIRDYRNAMVTWGESLRPRYVHKQVCDTRHDPYSCSLKEHLMALAANVGF
jgi:hypothetical protein